MTDTAAIVGHLVILCTTLGGFYFQWKREERNHRWQIERFKSVDRGLVKLNGKDHVTGPRDQSPDGDAA